MKALDHAFIRAYAKDGRSAAARDTDPGHGAEPAGSACSADKTMVPSASGRVPADPLSTAALYGAADVAYRVDPPMAAPPLAHAAAPGTSPAPPWRSRLVHVPRPPAPGPGPHDDIRRTERLDESQKKTDARIDAPAHSTPPPPHAVPSIAASAASSVREQTGDDEGAAELAQAEFSPGLEVDALAWPPPCDRLLVEAETPLAALVDVLLRGARHGRRVVVVTGTARGQGQTTVAACLARLAARRGARIALVDGDFEQPGLALALGLAIDRGWEHALSRGHSPADAAIASLADGLTVLPVACPIGDEDHGSARHLASHLAELAAAHDLVIVDMGPLESDPPVVSGPGGAEPMVAAVVVTEQREGKERLEHAARRLAECGIHVAATVENFAATIASRPPLIAAEAA
jgi:Mrp family chromosome partitioning ATPase